MISPLLGSFEASKRLCLRHHILGQFVWQVDLLHFGRRRSGEVSSVCWLCLVDDHGWALTQVAVSKPTPRSACQTHASNVHEGHLCTFRHGSGRFPSATIEDLVVVLGLSHQHSITPIHIRRFRLRECEASGPASVCIDRSNKGGGCR